MKTPPSTAGRSTTQPVLEHRCMGVRVRGTVEERLMRKEWGGPIVQRSSRSLKRPSEMDFYRSDLVGEELGIEHLDADGEGIAGSRLRGSRLAGLRYGIIICEL